MSGCNFSNLVKQITKSVLNINQSHNDLERYHIFLNDSHHDCIFDKIKHRNDIEYEIDISVDKNY